MKLLNEPCAAVITGARGAGKTSLAYLLMEQSKYKNKISVLPQMNSVAWDALVDTGITPVMFSERFVNDLPEDSFILLDDSSTYLYAGVSDDEFGKLVDKAISKSRQKEQTIVFVSHHTAKLNIKVVREPDILLMKNPSLMHAETERTQMKRWTGQARALFMRIPKNKRREYVYMIADRGKFFIKIGQARFWREEFGMIWRNKVDATK